MALALKLGYYANDSELERCQNVSAKGNQCTATMKHNYWHPLDCKFGPATNGKHNALRDYVATIALCHTACKVRIEAVVPELRKRNEQGAFVKDAVLDIVLEGGPFGFSRYVDITVRNVHAAAYASKHPENADGVVADCAVMLMMRFCYVISALHIQPHAFVMARQRRHAHVLLILCIVDWMSTCASPFQCVTCVLNAGAPVVAGGYMYE